MELVLAGLLIVGYVMCAIFLGILAVNANDFLREGAEYFRAKKGPINVYWRGEAPKEEKL
jgi:hypothetical protein